VIVSERTAAPTQTPEQSGRHEIRAARSRAQSRALQRPAQILEIMRVKTTVIAAA
jgi:hypothetical protein